MRSSRVRIVVVLPAPLGPRKPKTSPGLDLQVDVDDAAVLAVGLGEAFGPDDGGHAQSFPAGTPAARGRAVASVNWSSGDRRRRANNDLVERVDVTEALQRTAAVAVGQAASMAGSSVSSDGRICALTVLDRAGHRVRRSMLQ